MYITFNMQIISSYYRERFNFERYDPPFRFINIKFFLAKEI